MIIIIESKDSRLIEAVSSKINLRVRNFLATVSYFSNLIQQTMSKPKLLIFLLAVFFLGDLTYSFLQYYYIPLDGDISAGVVPSSFVQQLLDDPFGFHLLSTGEKHVNPNRFFAHFFFKEYMQKVPVFLQKLTDPITSVYLSCALMKIMIHFLVIFILSALISGTRNILDKKFLIGAALIIPLIQSNGYWEHIGIIDQSITYTFFYALPVVLLMFYLMTLYQTVYRNEVQKTGLLKSLLILFFAVVLPLSGPLIPGLVLIIATLTGIYYLQNRDRKGNLFSFSNLLSALGRIPFPVFLLLVPACIVSLYSLFLGRFDLNYNSETIPIADRYLKLPLGIYYQISQSLGVPLLLIIIGVNYFLIKRQFNDAEGQKIIGSLKWIGIFSVIYLLLLPLGGYRPYRPNILRYDTFMPITIALLYFYGKSSFFLIQNLKLRFRTNYLIGLFVLFAIFINSDHLETEEYHCERKALDFLINSPDEITILPGDCNIMSWADPFTEPKRSELNAEILQFWGITKEKKLYYQDLGQK